MRGLISFTILCTIGALATVLAEPPPPGNQYLLPTYQHRDYYQKAIFKLPTPTYVLDYNNFHYQQVHHLKQPVVLFQKKIIYQLPAPTTTTTTTTERPYGPIYLPPTEAPADDSQEINIEYLPPFHRPPTTTEAPTAGYYYRKPHSSLPRIAYNGRF